MIQVISLSDTKSLSNLSTNNPSEDSNVDFLELLLKDISNVNESNLQQINQNTKDIKLPIENDKSGKNDKNNADNELNEILEMFSKELPAISKDDKNDKNSILAEIKNILKSKFKQDNIILSKTQQQQFKQIDNLKDLLKFANNNGLNIKNIKLDIKHIAKKDDFRDTTKTDKKSPKNVELQTSKHTTKKSNTTKTTIEIKNPLTKEIISKKVVLTKNSKLKIDKKNIKTTKEVENNPKSKVDLKSLLSSMENDNKNIMPKVEIKKPTDIKTNIKDKEFNLESLLFGDKKEKQKVVTSKNDISSLMQQSQQINDIKAKSVQAQQTINSFKTSLDEAIKNYKPPISKIDIELNPKNLGKVEVSIIQRGNNIQVNMHTDASNVAIFQNNQTEFRQALANIGFSNIDMSFNSNQDRERRQNQAKKTYKDNEEIDNFGDIEIKADYQYA